MKIELNDEAMDNVIVQALDQQIKAIRGDLKLNKKMLKYGVGEDQEIIKEDIKNDKILLNAMEVIRNYYSVVVL